jgi:hypothetical protein
MKRIQNCDIPDNLFRVIKTNRNKEGVEEEPEGSSEGGSQNSKNNYFKVLKIGNFKRI